MFLVVYNLINVLEDFIFKHKLVFLAILVSMKVNLNHNNDHDLSLAGRVQYSLYCLFWTVYRCILLCSVNS